MSAMMEDRVGYIRVTNGNASLVGRYNGRDYHFKKDVPIDVPEIVAKHVFGFGMDDKSVALNRLGWARTSDELPIGMEKLGNVSFDDPPEMVEAPKPVKGKKPKGGPKTEDDTGTAGPPVTAGGTEGGDYKSPPDGPRIGEAESAEGDDGVF